jgi:NIMA (never in mitosis gene a)-related kinase
MLNLEGSLFSSYKIVRPLGSGTFGVVYLVRAADHKEFVIKCINLENLSERKQQRSLKEVAILESYSHVHLISYLASCIHEKKLLILMEFASGGDLQQMINMYKVNRKYLSEKTIWAIVYEVCLGVEFLHKNNVIHRDIKCLNILLDKEKRVKIADMGVCKTVNTKDPMNGSQVGTPLYLSPEIIQHKPYDNKVDIWAIGCVAYNLASLEPPFQADNLISLARVIVKGRPKPIPSFYSPKLFEFILKLLDKRASMRPTFEEIFKMIPTAIKSSYFTPSLFTRTKADYTDHLQDKSGKTHNLPRPSSSNSKDKIGSISKYPNRFKMYVMENNKLVTSRSLNMKPMPNLFCKANSTAEVISEHRPGIGLRPSSGVIRRDLDMKRTNARPASAYSYNRTTVKELESLD